MKIIPPPMKAADLTREVDLTDPALGLNSFYQDRYVMEPKLDGCRIVLELQEEGNRIWSRGRNVSDHFPHLQRAIVPGLNGVVLDGELLAIGPAGQVLSAATSLLVSTADNAVLKQKAFGKAWIVVFDILDIGDAGAHLMEETEKIHVMMDPYDARRELLEVIVPNLSAASGSSPHGQPYVSLIPSVTASADHLENFRTGEGFMIKDRNSLYHPGARSGGWWKFKWLSTADGFITGFKPGENSLKGLVGSVTLSIYDPGKGAGSMEEVATVGVFTNAFRAEISAPDGTLKAEYYGKVMEFACQGIGTQGMARHPRFVRLRPDKTMADCTADQLDAIPVV